MPFINGKYYINPTFGRAIELARRGKQAVVTYGPFRNAAGRGDVDKGANVKIVIAP